jgi:hypothetical protein
MDFALQVFLLISALVVIAFHTVRFCLYIAKHHCGHEEDRDRRDAVVPAGANQEAFGHLGGSGGGRGHVHGDGAGDGGGDGGCCGV